MSVLRNHRETLVPLHADNAHTQDWLVLLEASTIVGQPREKLRVALTTKERKLRKKRKLFGKTEHFLVLNEYDPRIHALYFCPQLYKHEDGALVPLSGEEIGQLMAKALDGGAIEKAPWYEPLESLPKEPIVKGPPAMEFDTLVVDTPSPPLSTTPSLKPQEVPTPAPTPKPSKATLRAVATVEKDKEDRNGVSARPTTTN